MSSISSVKNSPANAIKISAAILPTVNFLSFSLFDRCESNKPEKINILLLSGCCLWTLHDHKTLGDKNWDEFTKPLKKKRKQSRCLSSRDTRVTRQGPSPLRHPVRAVLFAFVCSVLEFCLQRAGVLFAVCWSFVCSVLEFLFAACWSLVCSVRKFCLQRAGVFVCSVLEFCLQCAGV